MPAKKKEQIKLKFEKNFQGAWTAYAYIISDTKCPAISVSAAMGEKAATASPRIQAELDRICNEYLATLPNAKRVTREEHDAEAERRRKLRQ